MIGTSRAEHEFKEEKVKGKLAFIAGVGAGYVLGSRAGRSSYEKLKKSIKSFWTTDDVQHVVATLEHEVKEATEDLGRRVRDTIAGTPPPQKVSSKPDEVTGAMNPEGLWSIPTPASPDVVSDPARNDEEGHDWADEGGRT